ncbi:MAG: hypothetical protein ACNS61_11820 [Candidatus Wenzhouxiangella sp. M2_3B_020]
MTGPEEKSAEAASGSHDAGTSARGKADRLNRWLTLGANLGVVLGLIILIVEVRQNAALTRAQMETGRNDLLAQIELSLAQPDIASAWVKSIRDPETMTDVEVRQVESHLVSVMLQLDHMFRMEQIGLVSRDAARMHAQNVVPYYFGSRHAKNWWHWQETGWAGTPMMEAVGPIVDNVEDDFMLRYLEGTRIGRTIGKPASTEEIEREARRFMEDYGADLRNHDRASLAARYAPSGATILFNGVPFPGSFDEIAERYRDQWSGPTDFGWNDLFFDVLGPDSIVVTGTFDWGTPDGPERYTYANVLQRHDGEFRIRREVETRLPALPSDAP